MKIKHKSDYLICNAFHGVVWGQLYETLGQILVTQYQYNHNIRVSVIVVLSAHGPRLVHKEGIGS